MSDQIGIYGSKVLGIEPIADDDEQPVFKRQGAPTRTDEQKKNDKKPEKRLDKKAHKMKVDGQIDENA